MKCIEVEGCIFENYKDAYEICGLFARLPDEGDLFIERNDNEFTFFTVSYAIHLSRNNGSIMESVIFHSRRDLLKYSEKFFPELADKKTIGIDEIRKSYSFKDVDMPWIDVSLSLLSQSAYHHIDGLSKIKDVIIKYRLL